MYIRSNILTTQNILDSLQHARSEGFDIYLDVDAGIREFSPRRFERGFKLYCESLNGKRARNGRVGMAASWDAYGVAMAYLYALDPDAEIAWYKNRDDFYEKTSLYAHRMGEAPWLTIA
jgi:hypothetical protein